MTTIALVGGLIVPSPGAKPIPNGVLVLEDGKILSVGPRDSVEIPPSATVLDCDGATVLAGFWNSHMHLGGVAWKAQALGNERLEGILREAFVRWGFVYAVETHASSLATTRHIQMRIAQGDVSGPFILTAGEAFAPENAPPWYITLPVPSIPTPTLAQRRVALRLDEGVDAIKLMTGSMALQGTVIMPAHIVRAAADEAHKRGKPVIAHPTDSAGARAAVEGGVDIIAHTFPHADWDRGVIDLMLEQKTALIPTLALFDGLPFPVDPALEQLRIFSEGDGEVLFGNDLGAIDDPDPKHEYELMAKAGMDFDSILTSLTVAPAKRFGLSDVTGKLEVGMRADVVVIDGVETSDPSTLGSVRLAIRDGKILFQGEPAPTRGEALKRLFSAPEEMPKAAIAPPDWLDVPPLALSAVDLPKYAGMYRVSDDPKEPPVTITLDGPALKIAPAALDPIHLVPIGQHRFVQGRYVDGKLVELYWPSNVIAFEMGKDEMGKDGQAIGYQLEAGTFVLERGKRSTQ